jgi:uncharacterized membrane protein
MRLLHLLALAFFVGGQLLLIAAVVPVVHRRGADEALMHDVGRRFAIGSLVALVVLVATGSALADHFGRWEDDTLQLKLLLVVVVGVLTTLHALSPRSRAVSAAVLLGTLAVVWLGVELSHG